jgi:hypothetical protein
VLVPQGDACPSLDGACSSASLGGHASCAADVSADTVRDDRNCMSDDISGHQATIKENGTDEQATEQASGGGAGDGPLCSTMGKISSSGESEAAVEHTVCNATAPGLWSGLHDSACTPANAQAGGSDSGLGTSVAMSEPNVVIDAVCAELCSAAACGGESTASGGGVRLLPAW